MLNGCLWESRPQNNSRNLTSTIPITVINNEPTTLTTELLLSKKESSKNTAVALIVHWPHRYPYPIKNSIESLSLFLFDIQVVLVGRTGTISLIKYISTSINASKKLRALIASFYFLYKFSMFFWNRDCRQNN